MNHMNTIFEGWADSLHMYVGIAYVPKRNLRVPDSTVLRRVRYIHVNLAVFHGKNTIIPAHLGDMYAVCRCILV